jgi:hypothetical protein
MIACQPGRDGCRGLLTEVAGTRLFRVSLFLWTRA